MPSTSPLALTLLLAVGAIAVQTWDDSVHRHLVGPASQDSPLDCAMRQLSYTYALHLLPLRAPLLDVFDALRLAIDCNTTRPSSSTSELPPPYYTASSQQRAGGSGSPTLLRTLAPPSGAFYVDAATGNDSGNSGSEASPFKTPARALEATRAAGPGGAIVLRGGAPFVLTQPLLLTPQDSGLTISAYPGEAPVLSGGYPLSALAWKLVGPSPDSTANASIWVASLQQQGQLNFPFSALFAPTGRRAVRARFPNGNPEGSGLVPNGYTKAASWGASRTPLTSISQVNPQLNTLPRKVCPPNACTEGGPTGFGPPWAIFCCFFWGTGGPSENLTTGSFWGVQPGPPGGPTLHCPGSMVSGPELAPRLATWALPPGGVYPDPHTAPIVNSFTGDYWGSWHWAVESVNASSGGVGFSAVGGTQARGEGGGDYMFVENVREELDEAGEWYLDAGAQLLYYCANATSGEGAPAPPPSDGWVAGQLKNLVTLAGTPIQPIADVALVGLTFEHTEPTFLDPFTSPSGGDWLFQDSGALRLSGTRNCSVGGSLFVNLGGTGVMVSGWNRGAAVVDSEFLWLGDAAVIGAGLSGNQYDNRDPSSAYGEGLTLAGNLAHEFGLFVKQTGFYYQAMQANTTVEGNVFFNGPRAGININDGDFGGTSITHNLGFNLVRETSDHGVCNTWDRQTTLWKGEGGVASTDPLPNTVDSNLLVSNYFSTFGLDSDDGSNGYVVTNNFVLYSGSKSLMGYNKHFINNTYAYVDFYPAMHATPYLGGAGAGESLLWPLESKPLSCSANLATAPFTASGLQDQWWNNTCIANNGGRMFRFGSCNSSNPGDGGIPFPMRQNTYFLNSSYVLNCGKESWNLSQVQERGLEEGSTVSPLPTTQQLVDMARDLLRF